jgi:DNA-binding CsgD family transcriptional regulator
VVLVYFEQAFTSVLFTQHESWSRDYLWITLALSAVVWLGVLCYARLRPATTRARFEVALLALFALLFMAALLVTILIPNNAVIPARCLVGAGTCLRTLLWIVLVFAVGEGATTALVAWGVYTLTILAIPVSRLVEAAVAPVDPAVLEALVVPEYVIPVAGVMLFAVAAVFVGLNMYETSRLLSAANSEAAEDAPAAQSTDAERRGELARERGLSARETEVLELICRGYSARRIGERLSISESTVVSHTTHIYRKFGVSSKQALIELVEGPQGSLDE